VKKKVGVDLTVDKTKKIGIRGGQSPTLGTQGEKKKKGGRTQHLLPDLATFPFFLKHSKTDPLIGMNKNKGRFPGAWGKRKTRELPAGKKDQANNETLQWESGGKVGQSPANTQKDRPVLGTRRKIVTPFHSQQDPNQRISPPP